MNAPLINNNVGNVNVVLFVVLLLGTACFGPQSFRNSTLAQKSNHDHPARTSHERFVSEGSKSGLVFENELVRVRHVTVGAHQKEELRLEGSYIIMLQDFPFEVEIPLQPTPIESQFQRGDFVRLEAGLYPIENPTNRTLEFLSIELKRK
jgi:hypothetical protein